ncbi:MAG: S1 RNA-binding domain-containing protein [Flavobacteriales bacterium]
MAEIGKINTMKINRAVDFGVYLDGGEEGEILMPKKYIPEGKQIGDEVEAFVYMDSEDRPVATTEKPLVQVGQFGALKVLEVNELGAFADWGVLKDLLIPYAEQRENLEEGQSVVVYVYLDKVSRRIVGSAKVEKFLDTYALDVEEGDEVDLMIFGKTPLGYKAIVNGLHTGVLYKNEVFKPLRIGDQMKGFIKKIREDEKIDLSLSKASFEQSKDLTSIIIAKLKENGGFLRVTDKSNPDVIYQLFGESKKTFKKAVGHLYKQRLIDIEEEGIRLVVKK